MAQSLAITITVSLQLRATKGNWMPKIKKMHERRKKEWGLAAEERCVDAKCQVELWVPL